MVYASIAGIIRKYGLYDIAVNLLATTITSLLIFIWMLQKVILSYENIVCASNKQIGTHEFYNINKKSIIDFRSRYNKNDVTLYCRKCDA